MTTLPDHPDFEGWWGVEHEFRGYMNKAAFTSKRRAMEYAAIHRTIAFPLYKLEDLMSHESSKEIVETDLAVSNEPT